MLHYKGFSIQEDHRNPYSKNPEFMFYPTEQGIQHDADYDGESYRYCGNCKWASSIEDAKDEIDEIIMMSAPAHEVQVQSGRVEQFHSFIEAVKAAIATNGILLTPIHSI